MLVVHGLIANHSLVIDFIDVQLKLLKVFLQFQPFTLIQIHLITIFSESVILYNFYYN